MKMKKTICILLTLILTGALVGLYLYESDTYLEKHISPDGKYVLLIKMRDVFLPRPCLVMEVKVGL